MRKIYLILLAAMTLFTSANVFSQKTIDIKETNQAPVIDGIADDVWSNVEENSIAKRVNLPNNWEGPNDFTAYFKTMYCDSGLFVLINVRDDVVNIYNSYRSDLAEVYLAFADTASVNGDNLFGNQDPSNPKFSAYYQIGIRPGAPTGIPGGYSAGIPYVVGDTISALGWSTEVFINADSIYNDKKEFVDFSAGLSFKMDVLVQDNDTIQGEGADKDRMQVMWASDNVLFDGYGAEDDPKRTWPNAGVATLSNLNSINNNSLISKISLYPSPATDNVTIQNVEADFVKVYSIVGAEVLSQELTTENKFDVSNLQTGLYVVSVMNNGQIVGSSKLIVK